MLVLIEADLFDAFTPKSLLYVRKKADQAVTRNVYNIIIISYNICFFGRWILPRSTCLSPYQHKTEQRLPRLVQVVSFFAPSLVNYYFLDVVEHIVKRIAWLLVPPQTDSTMLLSGSNTVDV